jgi:hypothetical protein
MAARLEHQPQLVSPGRRRRIAIAVIATVIMGAAYVVWILTRPAVPKSPSALKEPEYITALKGESRAASIDAIEDRTLFMHPGPIYCYSSLPIAHHVDVTVSNPRFVKVVKPGRPSHG